ncbi:glycosyltransferase family 4 protein [Haladaptatus sp. GCM10025707]|uniref:glycosyltransferase family 4 protein n=1 Tax=unclassified Haladaptatus TaxID=2622732 RepID=UPI0023E7F828|nr:glycosyltransferase family 4 protein [Haladaptatus sp. QDMS2]
MKYKLLASAVNHPDSQHPYRGIFNKRSLEALAKHDDCSLTAFAPIPYAPPFGPNSEFFKVPIYEEFPQHSVIRPRFLYWIPKSILYSLTGKSYRRTMEKATSETEFEVAHACHIYPDGYALMSVAENQQRPFTVMCHGHFLNNYSDLPPKVEGHVLKVLQEANHVFCVSDALTETASEIANIENISTIPIGATPSNFPIEKSEALRAKYKIDNQKTIVLFCGQFIQRKGINEIIEALPGLPKKDVEYIFIGHGGQMKQELFEATKRSDSPKSTRILESVETDELREWFAMADLFFLPSHAEGRPTAIYEAMASNTAVLSTRIEGVSEQVEEGKTGRLISPGNSEELTTALSELTENPSTLREMGQAGKERLIEQGWTWEGFADRVSRKHSDLLQ